ncbi:MAG TPA: DUF2087 domain-containing protein, partial [Acidothermaceae bacterium]
MTTEDATPDAASVLALLVAGDRLPVVAALVLGAQTIGDIAQRTQLPARDVLRVLTRLESAGLASADGPHWTLHVEVLRDVVTGHRWAPVQQATSSEIEDESPANAAVLRAFFRDGRLVRVPAQRTKRLVVLDKLARDFEPGVRYPEVEVNQKLTAHHPDYAALRRYLVEEDFLARENGVY